MSGRDAAHLPGHWLLARLGKKVLRPGGRELTERMLVDADLSGADVVELAPGLGRTAREIVARGPRSYVGVEADVDEAYRVLRPRPILTDEGLRGTLRFIRNLLRDSDARARVRAIRRTFIAYRDNLVAIEVIARKERR
ncbi:hypothetical protein EF834_12855 [Rhodococcus spongiicola]|uniref:SAM-dependent methyltransferase n=1 Tax=Rhodococcus spongiicola TaxID=2487352 RepID=A0A3S3AK85_9NOCA|nr:hypothetical protein [Rhodococcus spongiicola]RVW02600.1 hypothetical protein EF834_12855 [Rhodococcus spongiicola]